MGPKKVPIISSDDNSTDPNEGNAYILQWNKSGKPVEFVPTHIQKNFGCCFVTETFGRLHLRVSNNYAFFGHCWR
jgi:hypothetical protein